MGEERKDIVAGSNIERNPYEGRRIKRGGYDRAGDVPSEFDGLPGFYGNADQDQVVAATSKYTGTAYPTANPLTPAQERTALTQTDVAGGGAPAYGEGGERVV